MPPRCLVLMLLLQWLANTSANTKTGKMASLPKDKRPAFTWNMLKQEKGQEPMLGFENIISRAKEVLSRHDTQLKNQFIAPNPNFQPLEKIPNERTYATFETDGAHPEKIAPDGIKKQKFGKIESELGITKQQSSVNNEMKERVSISLKTNRNVSKTQQRADNVFIEVNGKTEERMRERKRVGDWGKEREKEGERKIVGWKGEVTERMRERERKIRKKTDVEEEGKGRIAKHPGYIKNKMKEWGKMVGETPGPSEDIKERMGEWVKVAGVRMEGGSRSKKVIEHPRDIKERMGEWEMVKSERIKEETEGKGLIPKHSDDRIKGIRVWGSGVVEKLMEEKRKKFVASGKMKEKYEDEIKAGRPGNSNERTRGWDKKVPNTVKEGSPVVMKERMRAREMVAGKRRKERKREDERMTRRKNRKMKERTHEIMVAAKNRVAVQFKHQKENWLPDWIIMGKSRGKQNEMKHGNVKMNEE